MGSPDSSEGSNQGETSQGCRESVCSRTFHVQFGFANRIDNRCVHLQVEARENTCSRTTRLHEK
jgi:hypothetical protein